jgi:hypothetical protein
MKLFSANAALFLATVGLFPAVSAAQDNSLAVERAAVRMELESAKLELRHYLQIEHPRQRRHLDAQIQLTQEEVRSLQERLREYRPFDKFSTGRALVVTIQHTRMCLLDAELRLNDLRAERNNLTRFHSDQWRILELRAYHARSRLAELERTEELNPPQLTPSAAG